MLDIVLRRESLFLQQFVYSQFKFPGKARKTAPHFGGGVWGQFGHKGVRPKIRWPAATIRDPHDAHTLASPDSTFAEQIRDTLVSLLREYRLTLTQN